MTKLTLIEKMEKAGSPKSWISEVKQLELDIKTKGASIVEYLLIIDAMAVEREQSTLANER